MTTTLPQNYRAAQFTERGGGIEIRQVEMKQPGENEVLIKVEACGLNSTDQIIRNDLVPGIHYPAGLGQNVVGTVVKVGQQSGGLLSRGFKEGMKVAAIRYHDGLAEYTIARCDATVELKKGDFAGNEEEAAVFAWDASRIIGAYRRAETEYKHLTKDEERVARDVNKRMGFGEHEGVIVVYGEGGFTRLAVDILKKTAETKTSLFGPPQHHRTVVVASSDRWSAKDYGVEDKDFFRASDRNIADLLKKLGGAGLIICTEQPNENFEGLLDATRFGAFVTILSPSQQAALKVPLGNVIAKALKVAGPPILSHGLLEHSLSICTKHNIRAPIKKYAFTQEAINQAWKDLEDGTKFEAPLVVIQQQ
ncbi:hypothetical protein JCM10213_007028 [Rhodosporidiobolus nylandii]